MKMWIAFILSVLLALPAFGAMASEMTAEPSGKTKDGKPVWNVSENTEITGEARAAFDRAAAAQTGVTYEPVALLGEADGAYCILCRAWVDCADSGPYYSVVYVGAGGIEAVREFMVDPPEDDRAGGRRGAVDYSKLFDDLAAAADHPTGQGMSRIDADVAGLNDELARSIASEWVKTFISGEMPVYIHGKDDPSVLQITGKHAFVVLGFQLLDGGMTDELKARCDAAAAAAMAFPDSILVCSGGATGENNPENHTEAGMMKAYLTGTCGIAPERIFTDESAMTTLDNALNTFGILKRQGIEAITLITSDYHQKRAHMLYYALNVFTGRTEGYSVEMEGNYSCEAEPPEYEARFGTRLAALQLDEMMKYLHSGMKQVREIAVNYGAYGDQADSRNAVLFAQMKAADPAAAEKWERIMALWKDVNRNLPVHPDVLPDGLPDTDELCIVALGFQLNPDGSMKEELIERLRVVLRCAQKYPNAYIVCTGGGTASGNERATEAGRMAEWLISHGVEYSRVIVEDDSLTTAQNAILTCDILEERYPQVKQLAIVSSDYHIATGTLLFGAEAILRPDEEGNARWTVVSNAAYPAPAGSLSAMFQAGALIELAGDVKTAFEIYYDTYDIHDLPPLE